MPTQNRDKNDDLAHLMLAKGVAKGLGDMTNGDRQHSPRLPPIEHSDIRTPRSRQTSVIPPKEVNSKLSVQSAAELEEYLRNHGINTSLWGKGMAKSVKQLYGELEAKETEIYTKPFEVENDQLTGKPVTVEPPVRVIRVARVFVYSAEYFDEGGSNESYVLWNPETTFEDGRVQPRHQVLTEKLFAQESPELGAVRGVEEELSEYCKSAHLMTSCEETYEVLQSKSYPSLTTCYILYSTNCKVKGLPHPPGCFTTAEPTLTHTWEWKTREVVDELLTQKKRKHEKVILANEEEIKAAIDSIRDKKTNAKERSEAILRVLTFAQTPSSRQAQTGLQAIAALVQVVNKYPVAEYPVADEESKVQAAVALTLLRRRNDDEETMVRINDAVSAEEIVMEHLELKIKNDPPTQQRMRLVLFTLAVKRICTHYTGGCDGKQVAEFTKIAAKGLAQCLQKEKWEWGWDDDSNAEGIEKYRVECLNNIATAMLELGYFFNSEDRFIQKDRKKLSELSESGALDSNTKIKKSNQKKIERVEARIKKKSHNVTEAREAMKSAGAIKALELHSECKNEQLKANVRGAIRLWDPKSKQAHDNAEKKRKNKIKANSRKKYHVFLSHKQSDAQDFARSLHTLLEGKGYSAFLDMEFRGGDLGERIFPPPILLNHAQASSPNMFKPQNGSFLSSVSTF